MLITLSCKLQPEPAQKGELLRTIERLNATCNWIAGIAITIRSANKHKLQKFVYRELRERFGISAQMAVRAIAKVCEVYKRDKTVRPRFRARGAVQYDQRILSWKGTDEVNILTLDGRRRIRVKMGQWQREHFRNICGQADLIYRKGRFYLSVVVKQEEQEPFRPEGVIGVDVGIVNLAVDSEGWTYKGGCVDAVRVRTERLKAVLQRTGTKSAKRHLRGIADRESRFRRHENHVISKRLVARAKDTRRAIALENLEGIRARTTVRRSQRRRQFSWAYHQLREFVVYKARIAGVPVKLVPPRGTSHECPRCRHEQKANRKTRDEFECRRCGLAGPADHIAAVNIAARAAVNRPIVPGNFVGGSSPPQEQLAPLGGIPLPLKGSWFTPVS
ncbi:MAG TPA: transposase [Thermoplasmata archaeon]|nr:transposase [Thermoplasmata archaeon]